MASYRQIHTKMWTDPWFIDLATDEKLVFIYLFSNDRVNVLGIIEDCSEWYGECICEEEDDGK